MRLRDLTYLVAVADHGSFRKAAAAMDVAQPTLSVQVRKLEEELGAELIDRSSTPLHLTPAGVVAVERARSILKDVQSLDDAVRAAVAPTSGTLQLGVFPTLAPYLLSRVMPGVNERYPELHLLITEEKTSKLLKRFDEGVLDAMLIAMPVDLADANVLPLFREEFLFATASAGQLAGLPQPIDPSNLEGQELLLLGEGHCLAAQVEDWLAAVGAHHTCPHRASSIESLRSMVSSGVGSTLLPALATQTPAATDSVVTMRIADPAPTRDIALVWRPGNPRAELLERLAPLLVPHGADLVTPLR